MSLKTLTSHRHGINTDVNKKLGPVISAQINRVQSPGHVQDFAAEWCVDLSLCRVNGYTITQNQATENRVRVVFQCRTPPLDGRMNFQCFLVGFIHVLSGLCPVYLYPVDPPYGIDAIAVKTDTQV